MTTQKTKRLINVCVRERTWANKAVHRAGGGWIFFLTLRAHPEPQWANTFAFYKGVIKHLLCQNRLHYSLNHPIAIGNVNLLLFQEAQVQTKIL